MRSLVVLGGVLVAGASVFGLWQLKNKEPQVAGFKAVMPDSGPIKQASSTNETASFKAAPWKKTARMANAERDVSTSAATMMAPLSIVDTQKQKLVAALGGKPQTTPPVENTKQTAGWWKDQNQPTSNQQTAQKKLVNTIIDKAAAGAKMREVEVKKTISYNAGKRVQQAFANGNDASIGRGNLKSAPTAMTREIKANPITKSVGKIAMLSKKERSALGQLVKEKKLPSIDMIIEFGYKSARLSDVSLPALTKIGEALTDGQLADATFVIAGHTDSVGGNKYNLGLSAKRAQTVRNFLKFRYNISDERLVAVGYGEERLKNAVEPEAAENRRVEFITLVR